MAKNPVNDYGLKSNVHDAIQSWFRCVYEIRKLEKKQKQYPKDIKCEIESAREAGYSEEEINETIGVIPIPAWYLIDE